MINFTPEYSTILFSNVWDNVDDFTSDYEDCGIPAMFSKEDSISTLFYLLYARYGNSPIANQDVNQFKYKVMMTIFRFGPTWEKKMDIQNTLRNLTEDDLIKGSKAIYNTALNPTTSPSTATLEELTYINSQNTTNYKKSKMDAYGQLWELLSNDVTGEFLDKFQKLFKQFVKPERNYIFVSEEDE